jgi:predicted neuraminidase
LFAAWFAGEYETAEDVAILGATRHPNTPAWSTPRVIADVAGKSMGQPVFLPRPNGELLLFFVVCAPQKTEASASNATDYHFDWTNSQPFCQRSLDNGQTWQPPVQMMDYLGLMFRSRPLLLPGRIILPVYDENTWQSRMMISDDEGDNWRLTAPLTTLTGNIHPCPVRLSDGRLLAYLRPGGVGGVIWRTESFDNGNTWSRPIPTELPNPNSGIDLLRLQSGKLVLAYNHSHRRRTPLCVALADEDEQWRCRRTLEDGNGEFSYPTLLQTEDGIIHVVYTYRREHIHHARFEEHWLREGVADEAIEG